MKSWGKLNNYKTQTTPSRCQTYVTLPCLTASDLKIYKHTSPKPTHGNFQMKSVQSSLNFQTESLPTFSRSFSQRLPRGWNSHLSSFGELSSLCGGRSAKSGRACAARWSMEPSPLRKQRKCSACSKEMEAHTGTLKYQRSCASLVMVAQESGWMRGLNSLTASLPSKSTSKQHRCFSESERHTALKGILETSRRSAAWLVHTYLHILLRVVGIILTKGWLPPFREQTQNSHKREICTLGGIFVRHFGDLVGRTGWRI